MKRLLIIAAVFCLALIVIIVFGRPKAVEKEDYVVENTNDYKESINGTGEVELSDNTDAESDESNLPVIVYEEEIQIELEEGQAAGGG